MNNPYNQNYFQERDVLPRHLAETLARVLKKRGANKVLDVGCGTGRLINYLNQNGFQAKGCDRSEMAVKISGQMKASATKLPFKSKSFDAVTAISLIEHLKLDEANKFIKQTHRILKPGGHFFLVTPNNFSLLKLIKGKDWFAYSDPTHVKFYSPFSLKSLLKNNKFTNFQFRFFPSFKTPADWAFYWTSPTLPQVAQYLFNLTWLTSPLVYFRDSFWILCQKEN